MSPSQSPQRRSKKKSAKRKRKRKSKKFAIKLPTIINKNGRIYFNKSDLPIIKEKSGIVGHLEFYDSRKKLEYQNEGWTLLAPTVEQVKELFPEFFMDEHDG